MKNVKGLGRAGTRSCVAVLTAWAAISPMTAYGQTKPNVTVVNPTSNPVNTRITNAVVPVEISNADAIPVTTQESEGSRHIFSKTITVDLNFGAGDCNFTDFLTVPSGKRMVIQYVSASGSFDAPAALVDVRLRDASTSRILLVVPAGKTAVNGGGTVTYASAGQSVHVYSDSSLRACVQASDSTGLEVDVNISGYYVDKP